MVTGIGGGCKCVSARAGVLAGCPCMTVKRQAIETCRCTSTCGTGQCRQQHNNIAVQMLGQQAFVRCVGSKPPVASSINKRRYV